MKTQQHRDVLRQKAAQKGRHWEVTCVPPGSALVLRGSPLFTCSAILHLGTCNGLFASGSFFRHRFMALGSAGRSPELKKQAVFREKIQQGAVPPTLKWSKAACGQRRATPACRPPGWVWRRARELLLWRTALRHLSPCSRHTWGPACPQSF